MKPVRSRRPVLGLQEHFLPVWLAILLAIATGATAEDLSLRGYFLEGFRADKGLPQNTVTGLLQSRDGYLWIVTPFGLARFDGVTFKTFTTGNTPGLRENMFTSLAEDRDGVLWAGTRDGLLRYEHGTFERLDRSHGLPGNRVDSLYPSRKGGIWAGTSAGLAYVQGRSATCISITPSVISIFEDSSGHVWFSVDKPYSLHRLNPETGYVEAITSAGLPYGAPTTCYLEEPAGVIWFGTRNGLHRWQDGAVEVFSRYGEDLPARMRHDRGVAAILKDQQLGGLWVALTGEGLHLFKNGKWLKASHPNWPALRHVRRALEDAEGNVWLGTHTDGLILMRRPRLQTYGVEDGLVHECLWSVCASQDGGVWVGGQEGFARIQNGTVLPFRPPEHWSQAVIRSIYEDRSRRLWVGDHAFGVYRFVNGSFDQLPMVGVMKALYEDRSGTIWAGTSEGMARIRNGEVKTYTTEDGLSHRDVRAFLEDRSGTLWIGTYGGGITLLSNNTLQPLTNFPGLKAWSLYEDSEGIIWIGTDHGLYRHEQGRFFAFTTRHGLFENLVNHLVEDDAGTFWISSNRGIYRVKRAELNAVAAGRIASVTHVAYGEADGMITSETNGEYQPAGCKTPDGRIWFPTQRGVVVIDPRAVYQNETPPPVVIEHVMANDSVVFGRDPEVKPAAQGELVAPPRSAAPVHLPAGGAEVLEIYYTANSFVDPSKVRFKHQLVGHDPIWRDAGNRRVAYYTNLRPGRYVFRVAACNNHGYWNQRGAEFSFVIAPYFHETWSFYGVCALGLIGSAAGILAYRLRVQRRLLRLEQQAALERERTRIAQDMHDDLGANLTRIAILSEMAKHQAENSQQVRSTADTLSEMARNVIDNISEIVWVTNPRNDSLPNLAAYLRAYAAEFYQTTPIRCRVQFPEHVPDLPLKGELRRAILLAFKEALANAAKHSRATQVDVTMELSRVDSTSLEMDITVADDGQGLRHGDPGPGGNGLVNMRDRLEKAGGAFRIISLPGEGTRVELSVRLPVPRGLEASTTFM